MVERYTRHTFGGAWTEEKLECLGSYLAAYNTALKNQPFQRLYIDAFAGTGDRYESADQVSNAQTRLALTSEQAAFFIGSPKVALKAEPSFDRFYFIEQDPAKCAQLRSLQAEYPASDINVSQGDANAEICRLCEEIDWQGRKTGRSSRAVLFLDPYGCQVRWETVEAITATKAVDMWYLFPSGLGINRMIAKRRDRVQENWEPTLDACLGTPDWRQAFYEDQSTVDLFGNKTTMGVKTATIDHIERFFLDRLKTVFPYVAESCLPLTGPTGSKMFSLCFACANPRATQAVRIANHLLNKKRRPTSRK